MFSRRDFLALSIATASSLALSQQLLAEDEKPADAKLPAGDKPAEERPGEVVIKVDASETPDLARWCDDAAAILKEWHPKIAALLATEGFTAPREIKIMMRKDMKGVAATGGTTIYVAANYVRQNPDDKGMMVHELTHAIQRYPKYDPAWLVEAIADYVRFYHYEPGVKLDRVDPNRQSYRDGYRSSSMFVAWCKETEGDKLFLALHGALRQGKYRYDLWKEACGKSLDRLWADFLESNAAQGRS